jgi:hypothetical protein
VTVQELFKTQNDYPAEVSALICCFQIVNTDFCFLQAAPEIKEQIDACTQRALQNEIIILEVQEAQEPAVFHQQLFNTITTYYEIQSVSSAGRRPKPKHCDFKQTHNDC